MLITGLKPGVNERRSLTFEAKPINSMAKRQFEPSGLANDQPVADVDHGLDLQSVRTEFIA